MIGKWFVYGSFIKNVVENNLLNVIFVAITRHNKTIRLMRLSNFGMDLLGAFSNNIK